MRVRLRLLCLVLLVALAAAAQDFSIVVLPDPQNYSEFYPAIFQQQTRWIVDNRTTYNVQFVIGVGDMVNDWDSPTQWQNADAAVDTLDFAGIPYAMVIGNHDYDQDRPSLRQAAKFNEWFGFARYAGYPWYRGSYNGSHENFWVTFSAGGADYLVLLLEMHPRPAVVDWAASILRNHPAHRVIVVTHSYMYTDDTRVDQCDTFDVSPSGGLDGDRLWLDFIRNHPNIFLVLSGHISLKPYSKRIDPGANRRLVMQTLQDWQDYPNGGDGWLRIYTFRPAANRVDVKTYSPYRASLGKSAWLTDTENQFSFPIEGYADITPGTGTIRGRVRIARGATGSCSAVAEARVATPGFSATTDAGGFYTLTVPTPNTYSVSAEKGGYETVTNSVSLYSGFPEQMEFFTRASTSTPPPGGSCSTSTTGVKICSPANNATVSSPVAVSAAASSPSGIKFMQVYVDGALADTVYASSLSKSYSLSAGTHRVTVQARDGAGTYHKSTVYVTVSSSAPPPSGSCSTTTTGVKICSPANNASVSSPVAVSAAAHSSAGIKFMQVYVDGALRDTVYASSLSQSYSLAAGTHRITVQARDNAGTYYKSTVYATVGSSTSSSTCSASSGVKICAPADGATVGSPVTVTAAAASGAGIKFMQIYVDGSAVKTIYESSFTTQVTMPSGARRLTVQAKDNAGATTKSTIHINVS